MPLLTENDLPNKPKGKDKNTGRRGGLVPESAARGQKKGTTASSTHTAGSQKTAKDDDVFIMLTITQN